MNICEFADALTAILHHNFRLHDVGAPPDPPDRCGGEPRRKIQQQLTERVAAAADRVDWHDRFRIASGGILRG